MLRFLIKLPFRIIAAPVWLVLATVNIVLVFLVGLSAGFCYLIAGISVVTEVLSIGFGISTDWTMKSGMDILKELEEFYMLEKETEKGLYFWMIVENIVALYGKAEINNGRII
ncbi:MAG: hypothetical protein BHV87_11305 [Clostridiales bacterium 36_14]|nr:MAG: hypothetical protein BHV87_11305 [Clostridiales bacterium 36_14]